MYHLTTKKIQTAALLSLAFYALLPACGSIRGSGGDDTPPPPVVQEAPQQAEPSTVEAPVALAATADLKLESLAFVETNIDLTGDFRVKKVQRDNQGHYYVALVSDVMDKQEKPVGPGYAILKFDTAGKELWRFPTLENSATDPISPNKVGSYLLGALSDMYVTAEGNLWLIGLDSYQTAIAAAGSGTISNFGKINWAEAAFQLMPGSVNVVFISQIAGEGLTANAPKAVSKTLLAAPTWWSPRSIRTDADGAIVVESSTGGTTDGIVQQVQRIDPSFGRVIESACYISKGVNASTGSARLLNVAFSAPANLVSGMLVPIVKSADKAALDAQAGRCWDIVGTRVMPAEDKAFKIQVPSVLAAGQLITSRIESQGDLLPSSKNSFEEYDVSNEFISGSKTWASENFQSQSDSIEYGHARLFAMGNELMHFGLAKPDLFGKSLLVVGNGRLLETKSWQIDLKTNSQRFPASLDLLVTADNKHVLTTWTDLHLAGETSADSRALRIAQIPTDSLKQAQAKHFEFEVPTSTGHSSFSSVRLADGANGQVAVFATIGTRNVASPPEGSKMKQAMLLIGFTK